MSKEDIKLIWERINCEACYNENMDYCQEKCECKCREFKALENILKESKANKKRIKELLNSKVGVDLNFDNYIPKARVEETIKQLKTEYIKDLDKNYINAFILKCKIEGLEELLKDGGE